MLRSTLLYLVLSSSFLLAEEVQINRVRTSGNSCRSGQIQFLKSGNDFAFVLEAFQLDLPSGVAHSPLAGVRTCLVRMDVTIPSGYCLSGVDHSISGGALKTFYSQGYVYAGFHVAGMDDRDLKRLRWREEIRAEDAAANFVLTLTKSRSRGCIKGKVRYFLNLVAAGVRGSRKNSFLLQLDSIDGSFHLTPR